MIMIKTIKQRSMAFLAFFEGLPFPWRFFHTSWCCRVHQGLARYEDIPTMTLIKLPKFNRFKRFANSVHDACMHRPPSRQFPLSLNGLIRAWRAARPTNDTKGNERRNQFAPFGRPLVRPVRLFYPSTLPNWAATTRLSQQLLLSYSIVSPVGSKVGSRN